MSRQLPPSHRHCTTIVPPSFDDFSYQYASKRHWPIVTWCQLVCLRLVLHWIDALCCVLWPLELRSSDAQMIVRNSAILAMLRFATSHAGGARNRWIVALLYVRRTIHETFYLILLFSSATLCQNILPDTSFCVFFSQVEKQDFIRT
jgi:hypothetical protein